MSKISVIVPVYNSEKYLNKCIESIINQDEKDLEIILVDDKSKDKSLDIMESYKDKYPEQIKIVENNTNRGAGYSRNQGIDNATGEYIGFVDSDDYIEKDMYSKLFELLIQNDSDVAITAMDLRYLGFKLSFLGRKIELPEGTFDPRINKEIIMNERPSCCNKLFRREVIDENRFPIGMKWEDYPFTILMLALSKKISIIKDIDYHYRINYSGTTCHDMRDSEYFRTFDIFKVSTLLEERLRENGLYSVFEEEIKTIQMANSLARVRDLAFKNIPYNDKERLVLTLFEMINSSYGDWKNNPWYVKQKEKSLFYRVRMECVERIYYHAKEKVKIKL
jgi:glycosyltransferase involved in cell wall biosynthesis